MMFMKPEEDEGGGGGEAPAETAEVSIRDALESAVEATETEAPVEAAPAEEAPAEPAERQEGETQEQADQRARDEKGRFAKAAKPTEPVAAKPKDVIKPHVPVHPQAQPAPTPYKPPQAWRPAARDLLSRLPPEFKPIVEEVTRREGEIATTLQQTAEARKGYQTFRETIAPFEGMIRAEGIEPMRAVRDLLTTAQALRTAPKPHRAQMIAYMVRNFIGGSKEDVALLDDALSAALNGQPMNQQPGGAAPMDPRVDQLLAEVRQARQEKQQAAMQRQQEQIDKFAESHEYFEDVRDDMSLAMRMAAEKGLTLSLEDAYKRACALHPEISEVLARRTRAADVTKANASTQRNRIAASSIRSTPAPKMKGPPPGDDIRASIEAAIEKHS
jgi:hypothetical protein